MVNQSQTHYPYRDEQGKILFNKVRIEPGFDGRTKSFYFERTDDNGNVVKNITGCKKALYRLPEVLYGIDKNQTIFLVEGEKDANTLLNNDYLPPQPQHHLNGKKNLLKRSKMLMLLFFTIWIKQD